MRLRPLCWLAALLLPPICLAVWLWPACGLEAQYQVVRDDQQVPVAQIRDANLYFVKRQIFQGPAMLRWDPRRHGDNDEVPKLAVTWTGYLRVPREGRYEFRSQNKGRLDVTIAEGDSFRLERRRVAARDLESASYPFRAEYQGKDGPLLEWRRGSEDFVPLRGRFFYRQPPLPFAPWLTLFAFGALLLAEVIVLARWRPTVTQELTAFIVGNGACLALVCLLFVVFGTRFYKYDRLPFPNETADEYNVTLNGLHLLFTGVPGTWSQLPAYRTSQTRHERLFGDDFRIVFPFFDHPPGLALLVGSYLALRGVDFAARYDHYFIRQTRLLPIAAAVLNALLLYFFAARVLRRRSLALLAVAFFALYPTAVYAGRLVKSENFLIAFFLGTMLLLLRYLDTGHRRALIAAAVLAGLSCTMKVTGLSVVGAAAVVLLLERRWRAAGLVAGVGAGFFLLFFAYGAFYDWDTFWRVLQNQQTRRFGAAGHGNPLSTRGLWSLIVSNGIAHKKFGSLTHVWFWLALAWFWVDAARRKSRDIRFSFVVWPPLVYLVFMAITMGSDKSFGWYRIPLLPFMAVAAAWYVREMVREANVPLVAFFCLLPLVDSLYWGYFVPATQYPWGYRLVNVLPLGLLVLAHLLPPPKRHAAVRGIGVVAVLTTFVFMALAIANRWYVYTVQY
ncbi:MAG: glycosyltransferase family 39 protein [Candidatus Lernaella stagnicola]|nr:glycosyltransferase family 39 protein [Candidatus Lernaella stagnicola]